MAVEPGTITSAKLTGTTLTIDGAGLGAGQTMVVIVKTDGTRVASDSITSSTDTQIVAVASLAAVGDTVEVITPTGKATKVIEAGDGSGFSDSYLSKCSRNNLETRYIEDSNMGQSRFSQAANVKIELLKEQSVNRVIASSTPNDGSQSVQFPAARQRHLTTDKNNQRKPYPDVHRFERQPLPQ